MNIYGERQHPEKFIPMTIKKVLNNETITIHGTRGGELSSRCWIHAREVCNGLIHLTKVGVVGESYNIVGEEKDVLDIANRIAVAVTMKPLEEKKIDWVDFHRTRPGHDSRYALSGEKLKKMGWVPRFSLDDSLGKTVRWSIQSENKRWLNL
tara:strand:- start:187 stop:642 length:456 start_codon:yes stop_codon:yes gene_type:complete